MFLELLESIISKVEGTLGVVIIGMDGISIEKRLHDASINIESLAAEYTSLLRSSSSTTQGIGLWSLEEFIVITDQRIIVARMITPEYFLLLVLKKDGNLGRARFELKKARYALAKEFVI